MVEGVRWERSGRTGEWARWAKMASSSPSSQFLPYLFLYYVFLFIVEFQILNSIHVDNFCAQIEFMT
jgi:hypothetical protein